MLGEDFDESLIKSSLLEFLKILQEEELFEIIENSKLESNLYHYDNWNGGTSYFEIHITLSMELYAKIRGRITEYVEELKKLFEELIHIDESEIIGGIKIKPELKMYSNTQKIDNEKKKVFISYSWDSKDHKKWVTTLTNTLRRDGIDATLDIYEFQGQTQNLNRMMLDNIYNYDYIVVVMTEKYAEKANDEIGGVGYESTALMDIMKTPVERNRVILLNRHNGDYSSTIPNFARGYHFTDMSDSNLKEGYEELVRRIEEKPKYLKPDLGTRKKLITEKIESFDFEEIKESDLKTVIFNEKKIKEEKLIEPILKSNSTLNLKEKIIENIYDQDSFDKVIDTLNKGILSNFIVMHKLTKFGEFLLNFDKENQIRILNSINSSYSEATGYMNFHNYEIFAKISYYVGINSKNDEVRNLAKTILSGCATYRANASSLLKKLELNFL